MKFASVLVTVWSVEVLAALGLRASVVVAFEGVLGVGVGCIVRAEFISQLGDLCGGEWDVLYLAGVVEISREDPRLV